MTPEIEKRIKLVKAGKVPAGKVLDERRKTRDERKELLSKLNVWPKVKLEDIFDEVCEKNHPEADVLTIIQGVGTVLRSESGREIIYDKDSLASYKYVRKGDFIIHLRSFEGGLEMANQNGIVSPAYIILHPKVPVSSIYLYALFHSNKFINQTMAPAVEGARDGRSVKYEVLKKQKILFPSLPEQEKIAEILAAQDRVIELKEKLIAEKQKQKKVLVQTFFNKSERKTPKLNVEGISLDKRHWKDVSIESVLKKVDNPVKKEKNTFYTQIGIYSHGKGLFYKEPVTGGSLGNKSVFWIEPNCFILNIVFAWEQAVAKTSDKERGFVASHRFPMFKPVDNRIDVDYAVYFFLTKRGTEILDAASPGGAGRNRTLGQERFLKSKITLPSLPEQQAIAKVLSAADEEISLLQKDLEQEKLKKKSLMQLLLTGLVRVSA